MIFAGSATPAALTALLAGTPAEDPDQAAYFDNPQNDAALPPAPIITFQWHDGPTHAALQLSPCATPGCAPPARPLGKTAQLLGVLADLFGERTAYAGPPTMTGEGYLLVFTTLDGGQPLFRAFTSNTTFTPDDAAWAKVATGNWTNLQITRATFANDVITASGGPFTGQYIAFCAGAWQ